MNFVEGYRLSGGEIFPEIEELSICEAFLNWMRWVCSLGEALNVDEV